MGSENFLAPYMLPPQGKSFVDVGANVGCWAFYVAKRGFEVYAFEPGPKAFSQLKERAAKYPNLHPYHVRLRRHRQDRASGVCRFRQGRDAWMKKLICPAEEQLDVAVRKLDSLRLPNVGVIKIDTEGYETPILEGAKETIQKYKPRLVIEVHKQTGKAAQTFEEEKHRIQKILTALGYTWTVHSRQITLHGEQQPFLIGNPKPKQDD